MRRAVATTTRHQSIRKPFQQQHRTAVSNRGKPDEVDAALGRGLWGESLNVSRKPDSSHFGVFKVPEFSYQGRRYERSVSVGIDLGTTNSCVSYNDPQTGVPLVVPIEKKKTTPTVIGLCDDNKRYFGHEAFALVKSTPGMSVCSGKRLLGKQIFDKSVPLEVYTDTLELFQSEYGIAVRITKDGDGQTVMQQYPVVHIMGMFMRYLKTSAENSLGMNVDSATISVPAHFSPAQRKATEDAAIIAGLDVKEIIDEPSAAALAYSTMVGTLKYEGKQNARIAVFDLGGGTFDLAILDIDNVTNGSEITASGGDDKLGGDDFDTLLIEYWKEDLDGLSWDETLTWNYEALLKNCAMEAKIALDKSEEYSTTIPIYTSPIKLQRIPITITRFEYEALIAPLLERIERVAKGICKKAGVGMESVDDVLLVGEMTRTPAIAKLARRLFKTDPVISEVVTPGTVVSLGTSLRGKQLDELQADPSLAAKFVYDKDSPQYERNLSGMQLIAHQVRKTWKNYQKYRKERPYDRVERIKAESGLPEEAILSMTKDVIEMELYMRKQSMLQSLLKEAKHLIEDIDMWKDPRQGFLDAELDEHLEVVKFWLNTAESNKQGEEQLAQAVWELRFYFEDLSGRTTQTSYEQISNDPEIRKRLNEIDDGPTPVRSFVKKSKDA